MPKQSSANTIARQWELLKLIPHHKPGKTARELKDALEATGAGIKVTLRTIERDLEELEHQFALVRNDKGVPYGWYWMPGFDPDIPSMYLTEALSLVVIEEMLRPLLPASVVKVLEPRFELARSKLKQLAPTNPTAHWADKVRAVPPTLPMMPPTIRKGILEAVQEALLAEIQIEAEYQPAHSVTATDMRLHPLGLVQRGAVTYLVAQAFDYEDPRLYALHRLLSVQLLQEPVHAESEFDLDAFIEGGALQFGAERKIQLKARVTQELADYLIETPLSEDSALEDGLLKATVPDSWQLRWWLLSQCDKITVTEPKSLQLELSHIINQAKENYSNPDNLF